jgi:hypothetical protein
MDVQSRADALKRMLKEKQKAQKAKEKAKPVVKPKPKKKDEDYLDPRYEDAVEGEMMLTMEGE